MIKVLLKYYIILFIMII